MKARYITTGEYAGPRMTIGKVYEIIGIEADYYRIINDENDPCLYNPDQFELIEKQEPEFWLSIKGEDGERYAYPLSWLRVGFFEDYHDGIKSTQEIFWAEYRRLYGIEIDV